MTVIIIDYGMGNLASVKRALEKCGASSIISDDPASLGTASKIILPGVGAFADGMHNLRSRGWIETLQRRVMETKIPLLGICLGMQLLAETGHEGEKTTGLGFIRGEVIRLMPTNEQERIPHVGWNEIIKRKNIPLLEGIPNRTDFYFVHSYNVKAADTQDISAVTVYGGEFVSVVDKNNIMGVQFHPEKSHGFGLRLLKNFLEL